jgi:HD domain
MKTWSAMQEATNAEILAWARSQPWAFAMAACPQDPQPHGEGDVWTHTQMVCAALEQAEEWPLLDRCSQLRLLFTGLFHDAGKPAATAFEPGTGRIRSPSYSQASAEIARQVLRDLGCDLEMREEIARLVRFHSRPPYLLEKPNPEREVISLSWLVNNRLLCLFAVGDTRGRCADRNRVF